MHVARVVGQVVSTAKPDSLAGSSLLLVRDLDPAAAELTDEAAYAAVDLVGAGTGEVVLVVVGGAARMEAATIGAPVDAAVVAIIDNLVLDGRVTYAK